VRVVSKVRETRTGFRNRITLVVDDDRSVSRLMAMIVAQDGYAALEAEGGAEAIHLAGTNPIDLLVTDVEMPGSGPELGLMLKQKGLIERSLQVTDETDLFYSLQSTLPLLAKSFNAGQLLEKVHAILND